MLFLLDFHAIESQCSCIISLTISDYYAVGLTEILVSVSRVARQRQYPFLLSYLEKYSKFSTEMKMKLNFEHEFRDPIEMEVF
jgi:hypothetical protein